MGVQRHVPAALPPGKTRYPLYSRLGGPQGRPGRVRKISPPTGIRSPDRPARSESLYRLSYPGPKHRTTLPTNFVILGVGPEEMFLLFMNPPPSWLHAFLSFPRICTLNARAVYSSSLKMEVVGYSESLASSWWNTQRRIPEEINIYVLYFKYNGECDDECVTRLGHAHVFSVRHLNSMLRMRERYGLITYLVMFTRSIISI